MIEVQTGVVRLTRTHGEIQGLHHIDTIHCLTQFRSISNQLQIMRNVCRLSGCKRSFTPDLDIGRGSDQKREWKERDVQWKRSLSPLG